MTTFDVPDMTCGHCASALTRALRGVDPQVRVDVDLAARQLHVESDADASDMVAAMQVAGYAARPVASAKAPAPGRPEAAGRAAARCGGGCGCGCR